MAPELSPGTVLPPYELLCRIGRGGMASVWAARRLDGSGRIIAVKAMLPKLAQNMKFRSMCLEEGHLVQSIEHENIVRVLDVGESSGTLYMAMEWIEGESLHSLIATANKRRPIPSDLAVKLIADAASGLHAAHELRGWDGELREVVHCDVSPHNILVSLKGEVKVVDFGVASAAGQLTIEENSLRGKFGYMSPEQARAKTLDRRSDIFSLGIVLYELTTGYRLFRGEDPKSTLKLVKYGAIPKPSEVLPNYPPELEAIVLKSLQRDPEERFQSAAELHDALILYLSRENVVVTNASLGRLLRKVLGNSILARREQLLKAIGGQVTPSQLSHDIPISDPSATGQSFHSHLSSLRPEAMSFSGPNFSGSSQLSHLSLNSLPPPSQPSQIPENSTLERSTAPVSSPSKLSQEPTHEASYAAMTPKESANVWERIVKHRHFPISCAAISIISLCTWGFIQWRDTSNDLQTKNVTHVEATQEKGTHQNAQAQDSKEATVLTTEAKTQAAVSHALDSDALEEQGETATVKTSSKTPTSPAKPAKPAKAAAGSVSASLARQAAIASGCKKIGPQRGTATVQVTISGIGTAISATVAPPFAGTAVGSCIELKFRSLTVDNYEGGAKTVQYRFPLKD